MLSMFLEWKGDDESHAKMEDCLIVAPASRACINYILDGLAEFLACGGANTEVCT